MLENHIWSSRRYSRLKAMEVPLHQPSYSSRKRRRYINILGSVFLLILVNHFYWQQRHKLLLDSSEHERISSKIWQISLPRSQSPKDLAIDPEQLSDTRSWIAMNPDYEYRLVGLKSADRFVDEHFAHDSEVLRMYHGLRNPGLKSDLLRYLILSVQGGVYCDTDTLALKPIDEWVPECMRDRVRLVVGIEFDQLGGSSWADIPHELQFCQWTIAAAPGHAVFTSMIRRAIDSLDGLSRAYNTTLSALAPTSLEVMNSTGPAAWTDVVWEQLQLADPQNLTELKDLSGMTAPRLYGDILVLPIDGFGMGQPHSHSTNDGSIPAAANLRHKFRGSWRDG
ncbi:hypothetical protein PFICI_09035 [Pestalotiopsis fici W106-1]|uniref:Initiation-specific alpha-1,6-mannosyltransferase n=1 Tax=Pestalotiopsis fici (strain W106-1 / CGMCC3.15140) TaxID=1229662 RepID=W3X1B3_PESFW|nr:uncharacterized protein PFICI_09035 [Pestalotiopsis fici W106-1]ETS79182.1 hypothetical protein PFICI_09035 [Pestalotiopsis fici W106-1]